MSKEPYVSPVSENTHDLARYEPLGLIANPFALSHDNDFESVDFEANAEANRLLQALLVARGEPSPKPIVIEKVADMPSYYPLRSVAIAEQTIIHSDSLNVLHAYVPFFMMRLGRVRATLQVVAERLSFRDFETTLACYVRQVLAAPDQDLVAYQVLGAEGLSAFAQRFAADPEATITEVFGQADIVERRPELSAVRDSRSADLVSDVEEEDVSAEIDATIGDAPGTEVVMFEEAEAREEEDPNQGIADYVIEYAKVHLSPVVSRALRVYRERGLQALTVEFTITKAPRKTLAAVVEFARARYDKIVLIYDGFEGWISVPSDTRRQVSTTLNEIRWMLESDAVVVMMLEEGNVPELEEQFSAGNHLRWEYEGVLPLQDAPDGLDAAMVDRWLACAALPGSKALTVAEGPLAEIFSAGEGSLRRFSTKASAAIENAASRAVTGIDEEALQAGLAAEWEVATS